MSPSTETTKIDKFIEDNIPLLRLLIGILGLVLVIASPLVWGGFGWAPGFVFLITGMNLMYVAVSGGR